MNALFTKTCFMELGNTVDITFLANIDQACSVKIVGLLAHNRFFLIQDK